MDPNQIRSEVQQLLSLMQPETRAKAILLARAIVAVADDGAQPAVASSGTSGFDLLGLIARLMSSAPPRRW